MDERIVDLLSQKAFEELNANEKEIVLTVFTESEYNELRLRTLLLEESINNQIDRQEVDLLLLNDLKSKIVTTKSANRGWINVNVPLSRVAAVFAIIFLSYTLVLFALLRNVDSQNVAYIYQTDTIIETVFVKQIDTLVITNITGNMDYNEKNHGTNSKRKLPKSKQQSTADSAIQKGNLQYPILAGISTPNKSRGISKSNEQVLFEFERTKSSWILED